MERARRFGLPASNVIIPLRWAWCSARQFWYAVAVWPRIYFDCSADQGRNGARHESARAFGAIILLGVITVWSWSHIADYAVVGDALYSANLRPSAQHYLGTDHSGRDVFQRLVMSSQSFMLPGFKAAMILAMLAGTTLGSLSEDLGAGLHASPVLLSRYWALYRAWCWPFFALLFLAQASRSRLRRRRLRAGRGRGDSPSNPKPKAATIKSSARRDAMVCPIPES